MKKGWKIFGIICGSLAGLGLVLCLIAFALGFSFSDTRSYWGWFNWNGHYDNNSSERYKGSTDGTGQEFTDVSQLDVDVTQVEVNIQQYDGKTVKVEQENVRSGLKLRIYQEGSTLSVETNNRFNIVGNSSGVIRIYLPKTLNLSEADLCVGAGILYADGIQASTLDIEVGAGQGELNNFKVNELSVDCGAGEVIISGESARDVNIECGLGSVSYQAAGLETDYNYDVECGIGSVQIGGQSFSGIAQERQINNEAGKDMSIDCGVGEVIVNFDEG